MFFVVLENRASLIFELLLSSDLLWVKFDFGGGSNGGDDSVGVEGG